MRIDAEALSNINVLLIIVPVLDLIRGKCKTLQDFLKVFWCVLFIPYVVGKHKAVKIIFESCSLD